VGLVDEWPKCDLTLLEDDAKLFHVNKPQFYGEQEKLVFVFEMPSLERFSSRAQYQLVPVVHFRNSLKYPAMRRIGYPCVLAVEVFLSLVCLFLRRGLFSCRGLARLYT